jgi:uncharacterized protein (TIGR00251 family)
MRYYVKVIANASKPEVIAVDKENLRIKVDAQPVGGEANKRLVEILAAYFSVPQNAITIVRGIKSTRKIIEVNVTHAIIQS